MGKAVAAVSNVVNSVAAPILGGILGTSNPGSGLLGVGGTYTASGAAIDSEPFKRKLEEDKRDIANRKIQTDLTEQLRKRAYGETPSVSKMQILQQEDRLNKQARGAIAGLRGRGGALGTRAVLQNKAQTGQALAREAGIQGLQERIGYENALSNQIAGQRATDLGVAESDRQAASNLEQLRVNQNAAINATNQAAFASSQQSRGQLLGGIGTSIAALASDEGFKKDIKSNKNFSKDFLDKLKAVSYEYKDAKHGKGEQVGILAQDLEKAGPAGKQMVVDMPDGKYVDSSKGFGAVLAAMADFNERVKKLESSKSKSNKAA